jgi:hypothetical protein
MDHDADRRWQLVMTLVEQAGSFIGDTTQEGDEYTTVIVTLLTTLRQLLERVQQSQADRRVQQLLPHYWQKVGLPILALQKSALRSWQLVVTTCMLLLGWRSKPLDSLLAASVRSMQTRSVWSIKVPRPCACNPPYCWSGVCFISGLSAIVQTAASTRSRLPLARTGAVARRHAYSRWSFWDSSRLTMCPTFSYAGCAGR